MAFPQVVSVTETAFPTATGTHTVDLPATVADGDLLILPHSLHPGGRSVATPSGWELMYGGDNGNIGGAGGTATCFAKIGAAGDSGGTVDVTPSGSSFGTAQVIRVTGWHGTIADAIEAATVTNSTSSPDPPSLSPTWGSDDNLWIAVLHAVDDDVAPSSMPSGYTTIADTANGAGTNNSARTTTASLESAAATENPGAFSLSEPEDTYTATIAIRPSGSSAVTLVLPEAL